ncbi:MAG: aminotransferase class V-fold PLP-dependent enzyme [Phycisphaera sp.]|nr:aminotransferase class V-fold PLP-dependent enzyme [Phycisphaera sp.]
MECTRWPYNGPVDVIYLDNNATTRPLLSVVDAMHAVQTDEWGNPSSVHRFGQRARRRVELARASVASLIGARERDMVFTSGGTESDNLALVGLLSRGGVLVTNKLEHAAVRETAQQLERLGITVVNLPVEHDGFSKPQSLADALDTNADPAKPTVVSIQWANNETGVIQDIAVMAELVERLRAGGRRQLYLHSDATQAVGKLPVDVSRVPVDLLTLSAHKFHGPKGVGALYLRSGVRLQAQNIGGPQERQRRGGTENVPGIVGMGVAAEEAQGFLQDTQKITELRAMRDAFERGVLTVCPGAVVNSQSADGRPTGRLWNTSNIAFPRLEAEAILLGLSERGVCASAGAACSSGSLEPSPVLLAMGVPEIMAHGSVRFSISRFTTQDELDRAVSVIAQVVERLSKTLPVG